MNPMNSMSPTNLTNLTNLRSPMNQINAEPATLTAQQIEAYVDAVSTALQLPIHAEHRPGVLNYFALAARMAELVAGQPLSAVDDPAEVFVPVSPAGRAFP